MKLHFIFLIILLGFNPQCFSQKDNQNVRFGIRAGVNLSHLNFSKGSSPPENPVITNWQPGIMIGLVVVVPIIENIYFQPEYLFSQMGGKMEEEDKVYQINYLSLPAFFRWKFFDEFSLLAGPQFDLLINAKEKSGNIESSIENEIEHRSIFFSGGLEYSFTHNLVLGMKYMHGLNHVDIEFDRGNEEFKYEGFQFSVSYLF
jgi:hypothetical protein